jgi:tetratricopeptide (TPR) repeat protein
VGFGEQEFQRVWGNRPLEDNWRLSDKTIVRNEDTDEVEVLDVIEESKKYNLESYITRIPTDENIIDSLKTLRNNSYYNLGLTYKEQFKENEIAASRFENLLTFSPSDKMILPTKYHLFKIYSEIDALKANKYKADITSNYSDSKYSKLILNPQLVIAAADDENSPEKIYEAVYCNFEEEKFEEVITKSEKAIKIYDDLPILPKFELLRAYAIGKKSGVEAFKTALEFVKLNYANTEEGRKAAEVIEAISTLD